MQSHQVCRVPADNFKCIFDTYKNRLYAYVLAVSHSPYAAEEITQEIFLKLWQCRDVLSEVSNMDAYIFTIARHKTLNYLRKAATGYAGARFVTVPDEVGCRRCLGARFVSRIRSDGGGGRYLIIAPATSRLSIESPGRVESCGDRRAAAIVQEYSEKSPGGGA